MPAHWHVKSCTYLSNEGSGVQTTCMWGRLITCSDLPKQEVIGLWLHLIEIVLLVKTKNTKHIKKYSEGKYTKSHSYIFTLLWKDVEMDEAVYIYLTFYILPCLLV